MRVLFIVPYTPDRIRVRPFHLIRELVRRGHKVTLATLWSSPGDLDELRQLENAGIKILSDRLSAVRSAWNCFAALPTSQPFQAAYAWKPGLAHQICSELRRVPHDVVHIEHLRGACYGLRVAELIKKLDEQAPLPGEKPLVVWDSVDCISHLFEQAARNCLSLKGRWMTRFELARTRRFEHQLLSSFDHVLVTSEVDRRAFERLCDGAGPLGQRVHVLSNGVDLEYFKPSPKPRETNVILFSGKMSYHANVSAVLYFVREILPRVWRERPDARFWVVGSNPPREIRALESDGAGPSRTGHDNSNGGRILVTGFVPDIRPFLSRATIAAAPLTYGAGIQNKVLEAMASGTPVVASPTAVAGLQVHPDRDILVAREPEEFTQKILSLLVNGEARCRLGTAGRNLVEKSHNWRTIGGKLEDVYASAGPDARVQRC